MIMAGDLVRLEPRKVPFDDQRGWWWRVTDASARGLDVIRIGGGNTRRQGVAPSKVLEVKKDGEW